MALEDEGGSGGDGDLGGVPTDGGVGAGGDGGDGGGGGDIVSLEDAAAAAEDEILSGVGDGDEGEDGETGDSTLPPKSGKASSRWAEYVRKNYKGDEEAALEAMYIQRHEAKRLKEEIDELRGGGKSKPRERREPTAEDLKAAEESDEEVQAAASRLETINRKIKTSQARQNAIVSEAKDYTAKIATLKAQIRRSQDPDEKAELRDEIDDLKSAYSSLNGEFMSLETTLSTAQDLKDDRQRELNRAKAQLKSRLDAREQEQQEQQSASEQLNADYDATFEELLQGYAVTTNGPESQAAYLYHATKNLLVAHLESIGSARPRTPRELRSLTEQLLVRAAKTFNIQKRIGGKGKPSAGLGGGRDGRPSPRPLAPPRTPAGRAHLTDPARRMGADSRRPPRSREELLSDPAAVRKRADAIFAAEAKAKNGQAGR